MTEQLCAEWRKDKDRASKDRKGDRIERRMLILAILLLAGVSVTGLTI